LGDIAKEDPDRPALRLLAKAIRSLPEDDQDAVWTLLLSRAFSARSRESGAVEPGSYPVQLAGERHIGVTGHEMAHRLRALRLLAELRTGASAEQVAASVDLPVGALLTVLRDLALRRRDSPRQAALLGELGTGSTLAEAAARLDIPITEATGELEDREEFVDAVCGAMTVRSALPGQPLRTPKGPLQTIPVRLPEAQYKRLKRWSDANGFPMAVIVRGLLERFLDDQHAKAE
jgi:hypothetical protein